MNFFFAQNWGDDIALDDGEGSDIGSELTEEMNQEEVTVVKKKKKVKLDSFEKFRRDRQKQVHSSAYTRAGGGATPRKSSPDPRGEH